MTINTRSYIKFLLITMFVLILGFSIQSDDKELFMWLDVGETDPVRPNVMILMDSSGSMNSIVFYPVKGVDNVRFTADDGFDPNVELSGSVDGFSSGTNYLNETESGWYARWVVNGNAEVYNTGDLNSLNGENCWTGCYENDGTPNNFRVGNNGASHFDVGETVIYRNTIDERKAARATIKSKYTDAGGQTWFELEDIIGGPIEANAEYSKAHFQKAGYSSWTASIVRLYGTTDNGNEVRYDGNYIRWIFIHADDDMRAAVSHHSIFGTFDVNDSPPEELSNCAGPGTDDLSKTGARIKKTFTRIQTAREVVCRVAQNSNTIVKLGLYKFNYDNGGSLEEGLTDMSDESSLLVAYKNNVWDIKADSWTPLAETLADIWKYIKPGPSNKTYWPVDYEIENKTVNHSITNPVTPVDWYCQNNYVVIMTDGESSKDGFNSDSKYGSSIFRKNKVRRTNPWEDWDDGWGDTDSNDQYYGRPTNYNPNSTYCPNYTCWLVNNGGTDYLDDVAYFINHQDMFPDFHFGTDPETGWPGDQNIFTYTIGFNFDNHMLLQTAINGDGAYYTANNYEELVEAFQLIITSINLRNFAFSAITAPRKTATATNTEQTVSYVGYFMPSQAAGIWEGHLLAFELTDLWGFDSETDEDDIITREEYVYLTEAECYQFSNGKPCSRLVELPIGHEWDASDKMPADRSLYTHNNSTTLIDFDSSNLATLQPLFGPTITAAEAQQIIDKVRLPQLGDIFHADVGFVGPPSYGKQFFTSVNPPNDGDESYSDYYSAHENRTKVIYTGTNDGILHMFYGDGENNNPAGKEIWGFIPDEVLSSYPAIVLDSQHTYTVDGRLSANDIFFEKPGQSFNSWSTILVFGLRDGGNAYYCMDISDVGSTPKLLWKFQDATHSGKSYGKPLIAKIKYDNGTTVEDKWVVLLTGGHAFNSENPNDTRGKAIFVLDAGTGDLLWMLGYDRTNGATDNSELTGPDIVNIPISNSARKLTAGDDFNFSIPSSLTAVDTDNDDFMDAFYFGNLGGHMFKVDTSEPNVHNWVTHKIYKTNVTTKAAQTIGAISDDILTLDSAGDFEVGDTIASYSTTFATGATGHVVGIDKKELTVITDAGTFNVGDKVWCRNYDPVYHPAAVTYDTCYQLWVAWGTGDRDRPRSSMKEGRFYALLDNNQTNSDTSLQDISTAFYTNANTDTETVITSSNGWYFDFRADTGEKIFDPEPIVLPDKNLIPTLYFNTYQPPPPGSTDPKINPCNAPKEGVMTIYEITMTSCGTTMSIAGNQETGRIAGGGIYNEKEYLIYTSESGNVADVPGGEGGNFGAQVKQFAFSGKIIFWKERKR